MTETQQGPITPFAIETHERKYRQTGETFREAMSRISNTLADNPQHFYTFREILLAQKFLPGGRVQADIGSPRRTTAFNCFVSQTIEDSMDGIMDAAKSAAQTMRLGGGIGYNFGTLRPKDDIIVSLDSKSSGVLSFMQIYDSICKTVSSAGNRRGAQMGVLPVWHPDIEEFIEAKTNRDNLTQFNISVGITDDFMHAVVDGTDFELTFEGRVYKRVDARYLWDKIMRATWDWAEPGVLYIDRINEMNPLYYCETIAATNPCGEQPLPPYGACLLGSFNLTKYLSVTTKGNYRFNWEEFKADIPPTVRSMDNVIDNTTFPLPEQEQEAKSKRRMGLGVAGLANAGEALGYVYGSKEFNRWHDKIQRILANESYRSSAYLAKEKGSFPLYDAEKYMEGKFFQQLDDDVKELVRENGLRNSHLLSIAPTGTISISANNISSGIEPVFAHEYERTVKADDGSDKKEIVQDYGFAFLDVKGKTADECTVDEHLNVLITATKWVDSAVSKTLNVGDDVTWEEFKDIYMKAWKAGCKGCTTFRASGQRYGILNKVEAPIVEGGACYYDPSTGKKQCE